MKSAVGRARRSLVPEMMRQKPGLAGSHVRVIATGFLHVGHIVANSPAIHQADQQLNVPVHRLACVPARVGDAPSSPQIPPTPSLRDSIVTLGSQRVLRRVVRFSRADMLALCDVTRVIARHALNASFDLAAAEEALKGSSVPLQAERTVTLVRYCVKRHALPYGPVDGIDVCVCAARLRVSLLCSSRRGRRSVRWKRRLSGWARKEGAFTSATLFAGSY